MSMKLYCGNKAMVNIAHNPVQHDRTKHVEVDEDFYEREFRWWTDMHALYSYNRTCKLGMKEIFERA